MTVLEYLQKLDVPHPIYNDRLGIGRKSLDRLLSNMEYSPADGCWKWRRASYNGYGVVKIRKVRDSILPVHRTTHELAHGPMDKSLEAHHLVELGCCGPICGNPDHIKPVTRFDHLANHTPNGVVYRRHHHNKCRAGHEFTPENTAFHGKKKSRVCLTCLRVLAQIKRDLAHPDRPKYKKDPAKFLTVCKNGHKMEGDNVSICDTKWGPQRQCRECKKINWERFKQGEAYQRRLAGKRKS